MPRNGSGTYTWPPGSFNPATSGVQATPGDWNTDRADLETAVSGSIAADGQTTITNDLPMATFKHSGVGNATSRTNYAAMGQYQDGRGVYAAPTGTANAIVIALAPVVTTAVVGMRFRIKMGAAPNTTAVTLNFGPGAGPVVWPNGAILVGGELPANAMFDVEVADIGTPTAPICHLQTVAAPLVSTLMTTRGDMLRRGATLAERLPLGATGRAIVSDGTDAVYGYPNLSPITNSLGGNVALNNAANYFTAATVAQGTSGTWFAHGGATFGGASVDSAYYARLTDGTTVIDSRAITVTAGGYASVSLMGSLSVPAANIKIEVRNITAVDGSIVFNLSGNSKDCTLTAVRIG